MRAAHPWLRNPDLLGSDGLRHVVLVQCRHWVLRMLKIRYQIVRRTTRETLDAWIHHDRLVEIGEHNAKQSRRPTVVLACILAGRSGQRAHRRCPVEDHVVFLVGIHGEVIHRRDRTRIFGGPQPGVLCRPNELPGDVYPWLLGISAEVGAYRMEILAVDKDPRSVCGVW
jgi:hypothetical protein